MTRKYVAAFQSTPEAILRLEKKVTP